MESNDRAAALWSDLGRGDLEARLKCLTKSLNN